MAGSRCIAAVRFLAFAPTMSSLAGHIVRLCLAQRREIVSQLACARMFRAPVLPHAAPMLPDSRTSRFAPTHTMLLRLPLLLSALLPLALADVHSGLQNRGVIVAALDSASCDAVATARDVVDAFRATDKELCAMCLDGPAARCERCVPRAGLLLTDLLDAARRAEKLRNRKPPAHAPGRPRRATPASRELQALRTRHASGSPLACATKRTPCAL